MKQNPRLLAPRLVRYLLAATTIVVSTGCTSPAGEVSDAPRNAADPSISADAEATASAGAATSEASTTATPTNEASARPSVPAAFQYTDILRVEVDGLAVREAPSLTSPLAQGYRLGGGTAEPTGDVRLEAGYFVSVHLGPVRNGDAVWYLVWPAVDARLNYSPVASWDSNADFATVGGSDPGWVAGSVGDDQFLTLYREADPSEIFEPFAMMSGTGDFESEPLPRHDLWRFNWAVAVGDEPAPCSFSVTLVPDEGGAEPVVAAEASTTEVEQGPVTGPGSQLPLPWGPSAGGAWDSFTVSINSGCTWAVGLWLAGHD